MLTQVLLHCFDIVEMYCLERVMQKFDLSQHISDYVGISGELHNISRLGKREENWLVIHAAYLNLWDARKDWLFIE